MSRVSVRRPAAPRISAVSRARTSGLANQSNAAKSARSAQRRTSTAFLQHGSLLVGPAHLRLVEVLQDARRDAAGAEAMRARLQRDTITLRDVLGRDPGFDELAAVLVAGFAATLRLAAQGGTIKKWLYELQPRPGDLVPLPAGTLHALGQGFLILEVQQPSDTTYRLYDWGRVGRDLHLEDALIAVNYGRSGPVATSRKKIAGPAFRMQQLSGGAETTPRWTALPPGQIPCGSCHGAPPPPPHPASALTGCARCHPDTVNPDGSIKPSGARHIDGNLDVSCKCGDCHPVPGTSGAYQLRRADPPNVTPSTRFVSSMISPCPLE